MILSFFQISIKMLKAGFDEHFANEEKYVEHDYFDQRNT